MTRPPSLVLASQSAARSRLLAAAGLAFETAPALIDEDAVKDAMLAEGAKPVAIAEALAELKALRVSMQWPGCLVIGADQVLVADGRLFSKPDNLDAARRQLQDLRGKTHELITAAVVARDGGAVWRHTARARLTMRPFSDAFIESYLAAIGHGAIRSVGCYEIEGRGIQLFSRIEGDPYVIQGLPLLPLMTLFRDHKILPE